MTDELGSRLERPIYFECKLNEPIHIGMQLLHPAATDHSMSISRQQVHHIFRFSLRRRGGIQPLSGGTAAVATGCHVDDRRTGIPTKRPQILPLPVSRGSLLCRYFLAQVRAPIGRPVTVAMALPHSVGLDNTGENVPILLRTGTLRKPQPSEGGSEAVTDMDNSQVHMEDWRLL